MSTHSSILAWEIPWIEEPGGLQFMDEINLKISKSVKRISFCPFPVVNPSSSRVVTAIPIYTPTRNLKLEGFLFFVFFFFFSFWTGRYKEKSSPDL